MSHGGSKSNSEQIVAPVTLRNRVSTASAWVLGGYAASQILRLASNLILSRLLFPEAFGLMAIAVAIHVGVVLLTDVGIGQSIIVHRDGENDSFLNTAWALQILKGLFVAVGLALGSGWAAIYYREPQLQQIVLIIAGSALIGGFNSTKLAMADRQLQAQRRFWLGIISQLVSMIVMIVVAMATRSAASLAWGALASSLYVCLASHFNFPGRNNRFLIDRRYAAQIFKFGGFVLLSSALTFASGEGSKLLLASLIDMRTMGLVSIASALSGLSVAAIQMLSGRVLFPAYAQVYREGDRKKLYRVIGKGRTIQLLLIWSISLIFLILAQPIINTLYDLRYQEATYILEILAIGNLATALTISYSAVLTAIERPGLAVIIVSAMAVGLWSSMYIGYHYFGTIGAIYGMAAASWIYYPVVAVVHARLGFWYPQVDIPVIILSGAVVLAHLYFRYNPLG